MSLSTHANHVADIAFDECVCSYRASLGHHVSRFSGARS